jgi:dihydroxyacetone kinase
LEILDYVGIARAQRNADGRQTVAQADGIDFALHGSLGPKNRDSIAGGFFLEEIPNALREDGGTLAHQVNFHEVDPAANEGVTFSQVTVALGGFEFVGRAEEFEHGHQASGRIANLGYSA